MRRSIFALLVFFSLFAWNPALAATTISTTIAGNVTWTKAGGPYLVSYVGIPAGATLTIAPGTVIKVTSGAYPFWVDGTLTVGAQNSERVTITSEYDNGGSTLPNPGDWRTIMLDPGAIATFTNTDIRYGSASVYNGSGGQDYLPIITNAGGTLTMDNATLAYGKNAGIDTSGGATTITNSTLSDLTQGLRQTGGSLEFGNNTFNNISTYAAEIFAASSFVNHGGNQGVRGISMRENIAGNRTWGKDNLPYIANEVSVRTGASLTIAPGTTVRVPTHTSPFYIQGTLMVGASSSDRVIITSEYDDGGVTLPNPGDWKTITLYQGATASFINTDIRYGGASVYNGSGGQDYLPLIEADEATLILDHSTLGNSANDGVHQAGGEASITHATITDMGRTGVSTAKGTLTLGNNTFHRTGSPVQFSSPAILKNQGGNQGEGGIHLVLMLAQDLTLPADGLPYVFDYCDVFSAGKLTIASGAVVKVGLSHFGSAQPVYMAIEGTLIMGSATATTPVIFTSILDDSAGGDTNGDGTSTTPTPGSWGSIIMNQGAKGMFGNAIIRYGGKTAYDGSTGGISAFPSLKNLGATLTLDHTMLTSVGNYGLLQFSGSTTITKSEVTGAQNMGVVSYGGIMTVHNSSIHGNQQFGLFNGTQTIVDATGNWWGSAGGPTHSSNPLGTGDAVSDHVDFGQWLTVDPSATTTEQACTQDCYSVMFIPGLAGSRLYRGTDKVWFPFANGTDLDAKDLFLNASGTSIRSDISAKDGDIIEDAYNTEDIYKGLPELLNSLRTSHDIADWKVASYDWRLDYDTLLKNGAQTGGLISYLTPTSTPYILQTLRTLAAGAKNHKVIIVTHSNGGLLAKSLVKMLEETHNPLLNNIEQVVLVAPPQLGAPKSIVSMLHGDENPIPGLAMSDKAFRQLTENMPSMFNLLPSYLYGNLPSVPFASFDYPSGHSDIENKALKKYGAYDMDPMLNQLRNSYPNSSITRDNLYSFLTGTNAQRTKPAPSDLISPNVLTGYLLAHSVEVHGALDVYHFPPSIKVTQIAGWGLPTISGVEYLRGDPNCVVLGLLICKPTFALDRKPAMKADGDETVPSTSALAMDDAIKIFVDLKTYNDDVKEKIISDQPRKHSSIMGSQPVKNLIERLVKHELIDTVPYTSVTKPTGTHYIMAEKHSPVDLDVYDADGNHTGYTYKLIDGINTRVIEENIPNSSYIVMGSSAYVIFPGGATTQVKLSGTGEGTMTFALSEYVDDVTIATTTFRDIPVTASSSGVIIVYTVASTSNLFIDENGDGTTDISLAPIMNGEVTVPKQKIPLTITADNKTIILGSTIPNLTATLLGFQNGDVATSSTTGAPICITTATASSTVGTYSVTCTRGTLSSDTYDFTTFATGTVTILYKWSGFLQPINDRAYNPAQSLSVFKGGSTVPVKFQLKTARGTLVQASTSPLWLTPQLGVPMSASVDESTYADPATSGTSYRYDATSSQHIYNWSTKGLTIGYWYRIYAKLNDGTIQSVVVGLR